MIVRKMVSLGEMEVDVSISTEDITAALFEEPDNPRMVMIGVNSCAQFLKAITPAMIDEMNFAQRQIVRNFLTEQAARFHLSEPK